MTVKGNNAILTFDHVGSGLEARDDNPFGSVTTTQPLKQAAFSPDGKQLITTGGEKPPRTWDLSTGRQTSRSALKGFSVCGEDKKFVWATAEIQGKQVVVSNPTISKPVAVRYGWADFPVVNLWNKEGLPASPFRTDDFPMITAPKK
jgi:WD40 repeat protein